MANPVGSGPSYVSFNQVSMDDLREGKGPSPVDRNCSQEDEEVKALPSSSFALKENVENKQNGSVFKSDEIKKVPSPPKSQKQNKTWIEDCLIC